MRRASLVTALASVLLLLSAGPAVAAPVPVRVIDPPGVQLQPFSNDQWVIYTSNNPATPNHLNAIAQNRTTHDRVKLNATGQAVTGGFDPNAANTVIYEQSGPGSFTIFSYDLDAATPGLARTKVAGVNSPADDVDPRVSGTYFSFFRPFRQHGAGFIGVYLFTRGAGPAKRIASYPSSRFLTNGSVGDTYATWTVCSNVTCTAYVYNANTKRLKKIPTVHHQPQYAPVVDEVKGNVYFVRSGFGCGVHVTFYRVKVNHLAAKPTRIVRLANGLDTDDEMSFFRHTGGKDLQFIRVNCKAGTTGIYSLENLA